MDLGLDRCRCRYHHPHQKLSDAQGITEKEHEGNVRGEL